MTYEEYYKDVDNGNKAILTGIARVIHNSLEDTDFTIKEIAKFSKISVRKINAIMNGGKYTMTDLYKVCRALGITLELKFTPDAFEGDPYGDYVNDL